MQVLIQEPGRPPRQIAAADGLTIGRGADNGLVLADDSASSRHARIVLADDRLVIEDLGSSNGTRLSGGAKLGRGERCALAAGLEILIGRTSLRVLADDDVERTLRPAGEPEATLRPAPRPASQPEAEATLRPASRPAAAPEAESTLRPVARPAPTEPEATLRPAAARPPVPPPSAPVDEATLRPVAPTPAAQPAPAAAPAAIPAAPARPASAPAPRAFTDTADEFGGTLYVGGAATDPAAVQAALAALRPRFICVVKKTGRVEPVASTPVVVGRARGGDVALALEDEGVSSRHAQVSFDGHGFSIEDLGGRNGTFVAGVRVPAGMRVDVKCDQHVRFGTVDALFVREARTGELPPPSLHYAGALAQLQVDASVPKEKLVEAERALRAGLHPGEVLIASSAASVEQWCAALERARLQGLLRSGPARSGSRMVWILLVALLAALGAIGYLLAR